MFSEESIYWKRKRLVARLTGSLVKLLILDQLESEHVMSMPRIRATRDNSRIVGNPSLAFQAISKLFSLTICRKRSNSTTLHSGPREEPKTGEFGSSGWRLPGT
jgi:hypothetical protein